MAPTWQAPEPTDGKPIRLQIDEWIRSDSAVDQVWIEVQASRHYLVVGAERFELPRQAVQLVMTRYGRPPESPCPMVEQLRFDDGALLFRFRFHAIVDAEARDYLGYRLPNGAEDLVCLATSAARALHHLAQRFSGQ